MQTIHTSLIDQPFVTPQAIPMLADGEIHLWLWRLSEPLPPRQLTSFARRELSDLLKSYASAALDPEFKLGEHGKPYVAAAGFPQFNVSHGGDCVAFAFCRDQELGVDVERGLMRRSRSALELATRFFAADEAAVLAKLGDTQCEHAFLHLWTCKEAVLKALGHGLSFGLHRLQFALNGHGEPESLRSIAAEAGTPTEWQIHRFNAGSLHVGCLAWRGPQRPIRTFLLEPTARCD